MPPCALILQSSHDAEERFVRGVPLREVSEVVRKPRDEPELPNRV
jgi:hypothetical protein